MKCPNEFLFEASVAPARICQRSPGYFPHRSNMPWRTFIQLPAIISLCPAPSHLIVGRCADNTAGAAAEPCRVVWVPHLPSFHREEVPQLSITPCVYWELGGWPTALSIPASVPTSTPRFRELRISRAPAQRAHNQPSTGPESSESAEH